MAYIHDYHMHSVYSEDGSSSLEEMCRQALVEKIHEIGFSEHWDVGPYEQNPRFFRASPWIKELLSLRQKYAGQLTIRAGLEVAEPHLYPQPASLLMRSIPFDYIIGSVHWVGPNFMFDTEYLHNYDVNEIFTTYFMELENMVRVADIDIVAHFDIPARTALAFHAYQPARYQELIQRILLVVINRGLAIEANTGGLRKPGHNLMPDIEILKWYAELGGTRVTLGSDAHHANQVGSHLDVALEAIRTIGLKHLVSYEDRKASLLEI